MKKNQTGFGAVQILLIVIIVGIIGGVGWFVYNSQKKTNETLKKTAQSQGEPQKTEKKATPTQPAADPYAGWKTFTTKYEKMSFKYPSDLTITDTSHASLAGQDNVTPGMDQLKLKGTGGFAISIQTGLEGIGGGCPECTIDFADPITVAGTNYYINYVNSGSGKITSITVSKTNHDFIGALDGKTIVITGTNNKAATLISATFRDTSDNIVGKTLEQYKTEHFVAEFKLLVQSISY